MINLLFPHGRSFHAPCLPTLRCSGAPVPTHAFDSLFALQNVYLHTKSRKKPCLACIFSHIFPLTLFAEPTPFKLLVSCKIKTLKFQRFQIYVQSPAFYPVFLFFSFSHYLELFLHAAASKMSIWYVFIHFKVVSGCFTVYNQILDI